MGLDRVTISPTGIAYKTMDTANPKTCSPGTKGITREDRRYSHHFLSHAGGMAAGREMSVSQSTVKLELLQHNASMSKIGTSVWLIYKCRVYQQGSVTWTVCSQMLTQSH